MNSVLPYYEEKYRTRRYKDEYLRDTMNPFHILDHCFINNYRIPKHLVIKLIDEIQPMMNPYYDEASIDDVKIPLHLEVLATLNFFASGSHQCRVGLNAFDEMVQSKITESIYKISEIIGTSLMGRIKFPSTLAEANIKKNEFKNKYGVPGIVGLIDCTHIAIAKAHLCNSNEREYINRKNFHAINVQMICDVNMRIMNVNARYPGSLHDSFVFEGSSIVKKIKNLNLQDTKTWLLGDSGYVLKSYMMVPYKRASTDAQHHYNLVLAKIKGGIERCFGLLKSRFRCLKKESGHLQYGHYTAAHIIQACAVLHNFLIDHNFPINDLEDVHEDIVPIDYALDKPDHFVCGISNREYLANLIEAEEIFL